MKGLAAPNTAMISVSIVSHGQRDLVSSLLKDLVGVDDITSIILTENIPEPRPEIPSSLQHKIIFITNKLPKGFGENHNTAFTNCTDPYFCVLNPDIRISQNPFPLLIESLVKSQAAVAAPQIVNSAGEIEDSVRHFPTPLRLLRKALTGKHSIYSQETKNHIVFPEWVAGMFMLFDTAAFQKLNGFDERYFLYYEDVDICARIWKNHLRLLVNRQVSVVHNAQRASHKSFKYLRWHLASMCRFFMYHLRDLPRPNQKSSGLE